MLATLLISYLQITSNLHTAESRVPHRHLATAPLCMCLHKTLTNNAFSESFRVKDIVLALYPDLLSRAEQVF